MNSLRRRSGRGKGAHATGYVTVALVVTLLALTVPLSRADAATGAPEILSYQGHLLDSSGNLLGGSGTDYCFKFSLYDSPTVGVGTKLWPSGTPSTMTVPVTDGTFSVGVGDTSAGGDALTYNFQDSNAVYLNVQVAAQVAGSCTGVSFETLSPRQRIMSSAYALNANTVGGNSASDLVASSTAAANAAIAASTTVAKTNADNSFTGTNTFTGTASTSDLVVSNGFTFGTATGILKSIAGVVTSALVNLASDVTGILGISHGGTGTSTAPTYGKVLVGNAAGGYDLVATSSLGISGSGSSFSTTSADYYAESSTTIAKTYADNAFTGSNSFTNSAAFSNGTGITSSAGASIETGSGGGTWTIQPANSPANNILFVNDYAGTQRLVIDSSGKVGIGTSSPTHRFEVAGSAYFGGNLTATGTIRSESSATSTFLGGISAGGLAVIGSATSTFADGIDLSAGCFAVGGACLTPSPLTTKGDLYVYGASGDTRLPVGADGKFLVASSTSATGLAWATPTVDLGTARYESGAGQSADSTSDVAIQWDTEDFTSSDFTHSTTTNDSRIQVAQGGKYLVSGMINYTGTTSNYQFTSQVSVRVNGSTVLPDVFTGSYLLDSGGVNELGTPFSIVVNLNAGDYFEVLSKRISSTTGNATVATGTSVSIVKLGANAGAADLAEWYDTKPDVQAGDVVATSPQMLLATSSSVGAEKVSVLQKATATSTVVGVISSAPDQIMGTDILSAAAHPRPVALAGRVPVKATEDNGPIHAGDLLTVSTSTPGTAMRATEAGMTIGRALSDATCAGPKTCTVLMLVDTSYSPGAYIAEQLSAEGLELDAVNGDTDPAGDPARAALVALLQRKQSITASSTISEIDTGRLIAGLEVITPRLVAHTVVTDALEPAQKGIDMKLLSGGAFTIHRADGKDLSVSFGNASSTPGALLVSIDADGNATFAGQLAAAGLTIGSASRPSGITMYDSSGAAYCAKIVGGALTALPGDCASQSATSSPAAARNASCTLYATPDQVAAGDHVVLAWSAPNADTFVIDHGVGSVSPSISGTTTSKAIAADTTFTGTVTTTSGAVASCKTTVRIASAPASTAALATTSSANTAATSSAPSAASSTPVIQTSSSTPPTGKGTSSAADASSTPSAAGSTTTTSGAAPSVDALSNASVKGGTGTSTDATGS